MPEIIWTPEKKDLARKACREWEGTPHAHHMAAKGMGIDCVHFVVKVLEAAGFAHCRMIPPYSRNIGYRGALEKITEQFSSHVPVDRVQFPYEFGDVLLFDSSVNINHCAILIDNEVWHSLYRHPVGGYPFDDFKSKIRLGLRLKSEEGER
jgi:hypothetical protein